MKEMRTPAIDRRRERPTEGADHRSRLRGILIVIVISTIYLFSLWVSLTEAGRRSAILEIPPAGNDYLYVDVNVVNVDLLRSEMTTRISFQVVGQLAEDELTPATDLQLVLNTIRGPQQLNFARGRRINPIEAVFPLDGNVNFYPFDRHKGILWIFATIPGRQQGVENIVPDELATSRGLPISKSSLEKRVQADTRTTFTASDPGADISRLKIGPGCSGLERPDRDRSETDAIGKRCAHLSDHHGDDGGAGRGTGGHGLESRQSQPEHDCLPNPDGGLPDLRTACITKCSARRPAAGDIWRLDRVHVGGNSCRFIGRRLDRPLAVYSPA
jgi:hypothetical protein